MPAEPIKIMNAFDPRIFQSLVPPSYTFDCIFDIGANIGQTARRARLAFPNARIYSFEPVPETYHELLQTIATLPNPQSIQTYCIAFGDEARLQKLFLKQLHSQNSLAPENNNPTFSLNSACVTVTVERLQDFAHAQSISFIDIVKMDVEGFELPVLRGAEALLQSQVAFIIAEVNFSVTDRRQSYFPDLLQFLSPFGFIPIGIYDVHYRSKDGRLDYCDAVFVNKAAVAIKCRPNKSNG